MAKQEPSGSHTHPSMSVAESQEVSVQLRPLLQELNRIIDRLEVLAEVEQEGEQGDGTARGR